MSTVYLAHDPHFERDVAVKLLPHELLHHPTFRRRFEREAKIVASLDHPAIVPVYDFGEEEGQPFLVMRFMTGGSLADRLIQGSLSVGEAARILSRLAPALDEVHENGVIHRDLKPSNILFDQRNNPFISDFGTAKLTHTSTKLTQTGGAVGTPAYMSPEQIQGDTELDGRSDIYTLGIILFEMLSGEHPYQTNTPIGLAVKHIFEPVPRLLDMQPDLPPECQAVISRAMAKNREDRFPTAAAFAKAATKVARDLEPGEGDELSASDTKPEKTFAGRRIALIIGNNKYDDGTLTQLVRPAADVNALAHVLRNPEMGAFDEVTTLVNKPTHVVRRAISQLFTNKKREDALLLYFAGHAALDGSGQLYLAVKNTEHSLLRGTAISTTFIADEMDASRAKQQVIVLDCHYSKVATDDVPSLIGKAINTGSSFAREGRERIVVTASDATHYIWRGDKVVGQAPPSHFTKYLIQGLETGLADTNADGEVTVDELFEYVGEKILKEDKTGQLAQVPRKWSYTEQNGFVFAKNPLYVEAPESPPPADESRNGRSAKVQASNSILPKRFHWKRPFPVRHNVLWAGLALLLGIFIILGGSIVRGGSQSTPIPESGIIAELGTTAAPSATHTSQPVNTNIPSQTATPPPPTATTTATATATATATPSPTPTATLAPTGTPTTTNMLATTILSSSIFSRPDSDSRELTFVEAGQEIIVLGQSETGHWLYVRDQARITGYIYAPRVDWPGDIESLPVIEAPTVATATRTPTLSTCQGTRCPPLTFDIYPLPGSRCQGDIVYRTVFMRGQGGNGVYTYYWNDTKMAGPLANKGFGFEVNDLDGATVIGTGKVVSGDGQVVEEELFVSGFTCNNNN